MSTKPEEVEILTLRGHIYLRLLDLWNWYSSIC